MLNRVNLHVHNMHGRGQITKVLGKYLTRDTDRTQLYYVLPKFHKEPDNPPGRPKVSCSSGPTEKTSQFVALTNDS